MKQEYKEKLQLAWDMLDYNDDLSIEENEKCFDIAYNTLNELVDTKDSEVLESLLEFFCEDHEDYGGICEHLKAQISLYYDADQIFSAFCVKFNYLLENDLDICAELASWCVYPEYIDQLKRIFNDTKSQHSNLFLDNLSRKCKQRFQQDFITTLRKDMEQWKV